MNCFNDKLKILRLSTSEKQLISLDIFEIQMKAMRKDWEKVVAYVE
jgi:hypothetical protein